MDGVPDKNIINIKDSTTILIHPSSIKNIKVKLLVKKGDSVKNGTPLFFDKKNEKVLFVSSCSGIIKDIVFGPRRVVEIIRIDNDNKNPKIIEVIIINFFLRYSLKCIILYSLSLK